MKLFLDCDGVLADFNKLFFEVTGYVDPYDYEVEHGTKAFWKVIDSYSGGFFRNLEKMPDAVELVESVRHLNPTILTGIPTNPDAVTQKLAWRDEHFPDLEMICCPSKEKYIHMHDEKHNIIIDDLHFYKHIWEEAGGTFILHTSAESSLSELREMGILS